jgi:hypothetical protein
MRAARLVLLAVLLSAFGSPLSALAATVRWTGAAQDVRQVSTIAVTGTWATGDTATLTINNKSLTVTIGSSVSTANVAAALAAAVDAADATTDLAGDESRNFGGLEIPEFEELDASSSGATLTLTSATPGVPFTLTRSEATAGDGALGAVTAVTAATGKNWLDNAANYSGGAVPVNNDVLVFDQGDVDVLYALTHFRTNSINLTIYVSNDYTGQIGAPVENPGGYREYRARYFQFQGGSTKQIVFTAGATTASNQGDVWLDFDEQSPGAVHITTWRGPVDSQPHIFLANSGSSGAIDEVIVNEGAVHLEPDDAPSAAGEGLVASTTVVGVPGGTATALCVVGRNAEMIIGTESARVYSGQLILNTVTKVGADDTTMHIFGGSIELRGAGDHGNITVEATGTLYSNPYGSSANALLSTVELRGGTLNYNLSGLGHTADKVVAYAGSTVHDPNGYTSVRGLDLVGCSLGDVTVTLPSGVLLEYNSAAAP